MDDIFEAVKAKTKTGKDAMELSIDILEAAESYAALNDPDDAVWVPQTQESRLFIGRLKILGSKLVRPVILSAMKKLSAAEFEKLLRVLEVIIVRWQVVGEGRTGTIERSCARLAESIWNGKATKRKDFIDSLSELYTPDSDFRAKFLIQENLTKQKAVYLLRRIEEQERSIKYGPAAKALEPHTTLTLEHILPQGPGDDWKSTTAANPKFAEMSWRTGNFCLLPSAPNKGIGNAGFLVKKPIYAASGLLTTEQVATYSDWTPNSIENRQDWLASKAVSVWRLS